MIYKLKKPSDTMDSKLYYITCNIIEYRKSINSQYRKLSAGATAQLILDYLQQGVTQVYLGNKYNVSKSTVSRYLGEFLNNLSNKYLFPILKKYKGKILIMDGVCVPTYRRKGYYCGKHKHYCVNVQALMDAKTHEIVYISKPLTGNIHDLKAANIHKIIKYCRILGIKVIVDKGYFSKKLRDVFLFPLKKPRKKEYVEEEKLLNQAVNRLRVPVERIFAKMKVFKICLKLRCRKENIANIILALHYIMMLH